MHLHVHATRRKLFHPDWRDPFRMSALINTIELMGHASARTKLTHWNYGATPGFGVVMERQQHLSERKNLVDPYVVLSWLNAGLGVVANGLSVAGQVLSLVLPFL